MQLPQVVVHESGRRWIDYIRVRLSGLPVRVRHSTSVEDCLELLRGQRRTTVLLELGPRPIESLDLVLQARGLDGQATVLVVGDAAQASLELPARELGAVEFVCEPIAPRELADLVERVVRARVPAGLTEQPLPIE